MNNDVFFFYYYYLFIRISNTTYRDSKIDQRARYTRAHVEKVAKGSQT